MAVFVKNDVESVLSLTHLQEGLLYHYLKDDSDSLYNEQIVLKINGYLDAGICEKAFQFVIDSNESLRTLFYWEKLSKPIQVVLKKNKLEFSFIDISNNENITSTVDKIIIEDRYKKFDITKPPIRLNLVTCNKSEHYLIVTNHHILYDGWSNGIILKEFISNYISILKGDGLIISRKASYNLSIGDFIKLSKNINSNFWNIYLENFEFKNNGIPQSTSNISIRGNEFATDLSIPLINNIDLICKNLSITKAAFFHACFGFLLFKYNQNCDVCFGTAISCRDHQIKGLENVVGLFMNTLPYRIKINKGETIEGYLLRVYEELKNVTNNKYSSLKDIQDSIGYNNEFFDTILAIENYPVDIKYITDNEFFNIVSYDNSEKTNYDLAVNVIIHNENIKIKYNYNYIEDDIVQMLSAHFVRIIEQVADDSLSNTNEIDLLSDEDKNKILYEFNSSDIDLYKETTVINILKNNVENYPDNIALVFKNEKVTYSRIDKLSDQLAVHLNENGVFEGDVVAIVVDRSLEMVISILAVLKTGAAYLPLDINLPIIRINQILEKSNVQVALTNRFIIENKNINVINVTEESIYRSNASILSYKYNPKGLIYIIFTSGSTGEPKGVMVEHRGVANVILSMNKKLHANKGDVFLLLTTISFDIFGLELYGPLLCGGRAVIAAKEEMQDPLQMFNLIVNENVGILQLTPSRLKEIIKLDNSWNVLNRLKTILAGGEEFSISLYNIVRNNYKGILLNGYGPTEVSIYSTVKELNFDKIVNIGTPVNNVNAYILSEENELLPIGVEGELCLSGIGLGRGYINDLRLTNDKFVQNPFSLEKRIYKTGDLARWKLNGEIEFLGRKDNQVKIRGFRIELGDIEYQLLKVEGLKEAIVTATENIKEEKVLCAYIIPSELESKINTVKIKEELLKVLPEYMVPNYFVQLEKIPLTNNGKVDKKLLPKPGIGIQNEYEKPIGNIENKLQVIWQEVLNIQDQISRNDNFFDIGGHSLKAISLVSSIHKVFDVKLNINDIFNYKTIKLQASLIKKSVKSSYINIKKAEPRLFYKLSSSQKRLYLIHQMESESILYNMSGSMILPNDVEKEKIEEIFHYLIDRHESFRTSFVLKDDEPIQTIHPEVIFEIEEFFADYSQVKEIQKKFVKVFDLSSAPLLRVAIVNVKDGKRLLLIDMHHIIGDGVSFAILQQEFNQLLAGNILEDLKLQYKDYSEWQNSNDYKSIIEEQESYWLSKFEEEVPVLSLPYDYPRPLIQKFEGANVLLNLSKEETENIRSLTKEYGITLYMSILSIFSIMLSKLSGLEEIVVGTPVAGRTHSDLEKIVGVFINTLPLRIYLKDSYSIKEFIEELKYGTLEAFENCNYQFEDLVEKVAVNRDVSRNPIFDVMFNLLNEEHSIQGLSDSEIDMMVHSEGVSKFDLTLTAIGYRDNILLNFEYSTSLFKPETIERFILYFRQIIKEIGLNPKRSILEIDVLREEEKEELLIGFNKTTSNYPKEKTIPQIFEEQVKKYPDHIAIINGNSHISYKSLDKISNQIAQHLLSKGVKAGDVVGLMAGRTEQLIAWIMGILKTGSAYLPINREWPIDRVKYMLEDSSCNILAYEKEPLEVEIPSFSQINIDDEEIYTKPNRKVNKSINSSTIIYIIYTSGTTGSPKGVLTLHYNVSRVVLGTNYININKEDKILQLSSYTFDGSVFDIYGALLNGSSLVMIQKEEILAINKLLGTISKQQISSFFLTTALFNAIVDTGTTKLKDVKKILFGGERISQEHTTRAIHSLGEGKLVHVYGPTETTVFASYHTITLHDIKKGIIPIGKPISNTTIYILDKNKRLVPKGSIGELYIGGAGNAKGYLNNIELTGERFIRNPYKTAEILYKTGDLGRMLEDGSVDFIGRVDHQIKIRGFRVELGEIEGSLQKHPMVSECIVICNETNGEKVLCAYIVSKGETSNEELRGHLLTGLPDYMVPSYFIQLEKMPLNNNGKIDRNKLPAPEYWAGNDYISPQGALEEQLAGIWSEVLNLPRGEISAMTNFFATGGHSLKAAMLSGKIHKTIGVEFPLRNIFLYSTIREQAGQLSQMKGERFKAIPQAPDKEYYSLSSAQKRLYLLQQMDLNSIVYNVPYVINLGTGIQKNKVEEVFRELILRHESLRTSFKVIKDNPVQFINEEVYFELEEVIVQNKDLKDFQNKFIKAFNLSEAPLLRACLIKIPDGDCLLMFDMHHIICDGVSCVIMEEEFQKIYRDDVLPELKLQYKDFSEWQYSEEYKKEKEGQEGYWLKQFAEEPPILSLPTDVVRPGIHKHEGANVFFTLNTEETKNIKLLAERNDVTLYMSLISVFSIFLSKLAGQEDIVIGTPVANRNHDDLGRIVGMFVNTLAIRLNVGKEEILKDFLKNVKQVTLDSFENQEYPFEDLVEKLVVRRDLSRNPLFDVMFNLLSKEAFSEDISIYERESYIHKSGVSKFDLSLIVIDYGEKLLLNFEYCTLLFKPETIERFIRYFKKIITEITDKPEDAILKLDLLYSEERQKLLYEFNNTKVEYPKDKTIQQLFEDQVERTPDGVALVYSSTTMTYKELNEKSNQLAWYLREKEIKPNDIIAILIDRSLEMVYGILGVLKSGGAYLPIDTEYPFDRKLFLLDDSKSKILLTSSLYNELGFKREVLSFDDKKIFSDKKGNLPVNNKLTDLAYVIYTSGTTGIPKGVMLEHKGIVNLNQVFSKEFEISPKDNILQFARNTFDASVWEIFMALFNGAKLFMLNMKDLSNYSDYVVNNKINVITIPPFIINEFDKKVLSQFRLVVTAGSSTTKENIEKCRNIFRYINAYGPTEDSICTTYCDYSKYVGADVTIGTPIVNRELYIVDSSFKLQPIIVAGELLIGGEGLARGYLNREDLNREKFIYWDPETSTVYNEEKPYTAKRVYRTGDLARWLPDGNIEFLGRIDQQVKIRGFRIELGEIEAQLIKIENIKEAVVITKDRNLGDKYLVAYYVSEIELNTKEIRANLLQNLPDYMIPSHFVKLEKIPLTPNGKIDRKVLPEPEIKVKDYIAPRNEIEGKLVKIWSEALGVETNKISIDSNFFELGGHSLLIIKIVQKIKNELGYEFKVIDLFRYTTIREIVDCINGSKSDDVTTFDRVDDINRGKNYIKSLLNEKDPNCIVNKDLDIAVIGMSGKFPKSEDLNIFWENLKGGKELITFFDEEELRDAGISEELIKNPNYIKSKGFLEGSEFFDAAFFGYTPDEAETMDPQIRLFYEQSWKALEDAGCVPAKFNGSIGVYAGASGNLEWEASNYLEGRNSWEASNIIDKDNLATNIAYKLNLKGPAITIHTACSTSLVAISTACSGILSGHCKIAIAGGVNINPGKCGYMYYEGMINSPDGHNRTFDEKAGGTVGGSGAGVVVLKRLQDALEDGDHIYAIVKGSAINNDGNRKVGFTAPSINGQLEVIRAAMHVADVEPESIGYVECHGTATNIGDPIEVEALRLAFNTEKRNYCALGSVKSNTGHLDAAAGVVGFIKAALCLKNKMLVPSLHFEKPNPKIEFKDSPFYVNTQTKKWESWGSPLRAGVTSLGVGGTNVHVILEEAPKLDELPSNNEHKLFIVSGKTEAAADNNLEKIKGYLLKGSGINLDDAAYTMQVGREHFNHRRIFVCSSIEELKGGSLPTRQNKIISSKKHGVVFMFSGQGSQYTNMGKGLYENDSIFKGNMDTCFDILKNLSGDDFRKKMYPETGTGVPENINPTELAQPLLFILEYSLAKHLMEKGISPEAMIGHSIGEYVAACLSGVFSLEDGLKLVLARGRIMSKAPVGKMLSISIDEKELAGIIDENISLAAMNSTGLCVVSGSTEEVEKFRVKIASSGYESTYLHTSHAFHSYMMDGVLDEFRETLKEIKLNTPIKKYISNLSGTWVEGTEVTQAEYWVNHLRGTVRFCEGIGELLKEEGHIFIEVGPGGALNTFVENHTSFTKNQSSIRMLRKPKEKLDDSYYLTQQIGELWLNGYDIDWGKYHEGTERYKLPMPGYEFDKHKFEIRKDTSKIINQLQEKNNYLPERRKQMSEWLYVPSWEQSVFYPEIGIDNTNERFLIFCNNSELCLDTIKMLKEKGHSLTEVWLGSDFNILGNDVFEINEDTTNDFVNLKNHFNREDKTFGKILHFWSYGDVYEYNIGDINEKEINRGYRTFINVKKELLNFIGIESQIIAFTSGVFNISGVETIYPERGMAATILKVLRQENPELNIKVVDIDLHYTNKDIQLKRIQNEIFTKNEDIIIAYRQGKRLVEGFKSINFKLQRKSNLLKTGGVYLITGGLGNIGLDLAEYLGKEYKAKLILLNRSSFPERNNWEEWLNEKGLEDTISKKINIVEEIERNGGEVRIYNIDISDRVKLEEVFLKNKKEWGSINGVFHFAGTTSQNFFTSIDNLTEAIDKEHFNSKLHGLLALRKIIEKNKIDFCLVTSSVSSILGGIGFGSYASSNVFMNGVINEDLRSDYIPWICVDLDGWVSSRVNSDANESSDRYMVTSEGIKLIENLLYLRECGVSSVVHSISDLNIRYKKWVINLIEENNEPETESEVKLYSRPALSNEYVEPVSEIEKRLAELWSTFLGYEKNGIYDDFFELGGDSLKAMRLFAMIQKEFGVKLEIKEIFMRPNIALISEYIAENLEEIVI